STGVHLPPVPEMDGLTVRLHRVLAVLEIVTGQVVEVPTTRLGVLPVFAVAEMVGDERVPVSGAWMVGLHGSLLKMSRVAAVAQGGARESRTWTIAVPPPATVRGSTGEGARENSPGVPVMASPEIASGDCPVLVIPTPLVSSAQTVPKAAPNEET